MASRGFKSLLLAAVAACLLLPAYADGAWVVRGKGFGHGVGMSQYGAKGQADAGRNHRQILRHYYTGVAIGQAPAKRVRVLITTGLGSLPFSSAKRACGRNIQPAKTYSFRVSGARITLNRPNGKRLAGCGREGAAVGSGGVRFAGVGTYRGQLVARNVSGSIYAINNVGLEAYVQGVIPNEVPASWPAAALRAQAVAARSYALATRVNGSGYNLYDDTRSQVYNGRSSEHRATNRATKATKGQVIKSNGKVATAYFFSTSGGRTENSEFVWSSSLPYLKSVRDPWDKGSPYHTWRFRISDARMNAAVSGLGVGKVRRIRILKTGKSPRVVRARVIGSAGRKSVSGDYLRSAFGLRSTWVRFLKK